MPFWQIIAAAFVVFVVFLILRRLFSGEGRIREVDHRGPNRLDRVDSDMEQRLANTLRSQGKISAIKDLRDATGWGLRESKDYIDALERTMPLANDRILSSASSDQTFETGGAVFDSLDVSSRERILADLREGRKINAIKELRALTGLGLKESKDIVDEVDAKMPR